MKNLIVICTFLIGLIIAFSCNKENNPSEENGIIEFKCINPFSTNSKSNSKLIFSNPLLTGDTTKTIMTSLKFAIGDVWVSRGEVKVGEPDTLEWIKLTSVTNTSHKLFEDYSFPSKEIPAGDYKSIKTTFRNIWYRQVKLFSDTTVAYELLETMGSSSNPCDSNDTSWAKTNYFGPGGNHILADNGKFQLASEGEKVNGFKIESGKKTKISWRLGAGVTEPCINYLLDLNGNRIWDCGIDDLYDECPPNMQYMWDFVVEYD
ncbi:MAG: hypothetical protein PHC83_06665 [Bacteroidales bacterium]|nr:hypothetical protein [Bacteroidales bacterium]